jgi:uncharacterized protein YndB with AHSA1/START domain
MASETAHGEAALDEAAGDLEFTRLIDAPRDLVFAVWTEAKHFAQWFGPHEVEVPFCKIEPRPGGLIHFCHRLRGLEIWVKGVYREFVAGERLVFELRFVDADGRAIAHPMFPDWPLDAIILTTVTFADRGGKTELDIRQQILPAEAAAKDVVKRLREATSAGWTETLERLTEYLSNKS